MDLLVPRRLRPGDDVRVIAPSCSMAMVTEHDHSPLIEARFAELGLTLSYAEHVNVRDARDSSPVADRVADLHAAFTDPGVAGVVTAIGGVNANELLPHLDWDLIRAHPKVFCGYSDITALQGAMLARSGLVTWYGPHWSSFGMRDHFERTWEWFRAALLGAGPVTITPGTTYTDDAWFLDQDDRTVQESGGWWTLRPGRATGRLIGGNLCTLLLLHGTPYAPDLTDAVLVLEDDELSDLGAVARNLTAVLQQPGADRVRGLVLGRFQDASGIDRKALDEVLAVHPLLDRVPVLANVDVGHTQPLATVPLGGRIELDADAQRLVVAEHPDRQED